MLRFSAWIMGKDTRLTICPESWPGAAAGRRVHGVHYDQTLSERVVCGYTHTLAVSRYSLRSVHAHIRVACAVDTRQVVRRLQALVSVALHTGQTVRRTAVPLSIYCTLPSVGSPSVKNVQPLKNELPSCQEVSLRPLVCKWHTHVVLLQLIRR